MEKFVVRGLKKGLHGRVQISGSKNAALPVMAACLLTEDVCELWNVPPLSDVIDMIELLRALGAFVEYDGQCLRIQAKEIYRNTEEMEMAGRLRASFLAAGALLGRCGFLGGRQVY